VTEVTGPDVVTVVVADVAEVGVRPASELGAPRPITTAGTGAELTMDVSRPPAQSSNPPTTNTAAATNKGSSPRLSGGRAESRWAFGYFVCFDSIVTISLPQIHEQVVNWA